MNSLKKSTELSENISESTRILSKYPDRIPVIIKTKNQKLAKMLKKNKFLVPKDLSIAYLLLSIRKQISMDKSKALFIFCDNTLISGSEMVNVIYNEYKYKHNIKQDSDNFLYLSIEEENTFGQN